METSKEERPVVAKKRPFVKEDEPVEAKSRRTENLDSQESKVDEQIIQEKHQIMEGPVPFKQHCTMNIFGAKIGNSTRSNFDK